MSKSTMLVTVGILGSIWCFFAPLSMMNASQSNVIMYGIATASFGVMFIVGLYLKTNYHASRRDNK